jgi:hypothetical protein
MIELIKLIKTLSELGFLVLKIKGKSLISNIEQGISTTKKEEGQNHQLHLNHP